MKVIDESLDESYIDIFWFCPLDWNVDRPNMEKRPNEFLSALIFKL